MSALQCAACGAQAEGNCSVHRDGFCEGPEVDLCDGCGAEELPALETIWAMIALRRKVSSIDDARRRREEGK